ncbi:MAG: hypothetical protein KAH18_05165 [Psychromonas sp.]|nr:hypothetical protein [Psychromonas sp.]
MILQEIAHYIKEEVRVEEGLLLKHFHLTQSSLAPMISVLLKRGNIQKTVNTCGKNLAVRTYYSFYQKARIPVTTIT